MSGLLMGIMLARPVSSLVADALGWHAIFVLSADRHGRAGLLLRAKLPLRQPKAACTTSNCWFDVASAENHAHPAPPRGLPGCMFGAFSLFWTCVSLELTGRTSTSARPAWPSLRWSA
jgi:predicted MFS family arabinose efflux permease